jgi:ABC-type antimicrobial peptide transport system permease subunit
MMPSLAAAVRATNAGVPAYDVFPMQALVDRSAAQRRFLMLLLSGFASAALLLAALGIYGTVAQMVQQRTREIGLRMALGASPREALQLVLAHGAVLTGVGLAIGGAAALVLTRAVSKLLFEVRPLDPAAFAGGAGLLIAAAALACYLPARRATKVDPLAALRRD